ncbi:unnamed protein product [Phytophthora fragariaefolia]|uniref:Unnamed protein product n=1 Tax=Phytophthora fragariaefolia TaxID=1490495 RepID=A0A9W6U9K2_9STRA|nr:unnamed protein product [Phytophthora fragariaefolia]
MDDIKPASISEYLVTGKLEKVNAGEALPIITPTTPKATTPVKSPAAHAEPAATAVAATAAATPDDIPSTTSECPPSTTSEVSGGADAPDDTSAVDPFPAAFTQELHDNMNMFLKTATAYLVMLINDHTGDSGSGM